MCLCMLDKEEIEILLSLASKEETSMLKSANDASSYSVASQYVDSAGIMNTICIKLSMIKEDIECRSKRK